MKEAIGKFINSHPYLSYMLAGTIVANVCGTIKVLLRGYPDRSSPTISFSNPTSESDEVEVVDDNAASD